MSDHVTRELGGYVLGGLEPEEAERVRRHLLTCAACRHEHERLASLPALLELAGPARTAAVVSPPSGLEDAVVGTVAARAEEAGGERRRRPRVRTRRAGIAAALAGALAVLAAVALRGSGGGGEEIGTVALRAPAGAGSAIASLARVPWGTRVQLDVEGIAPTRAGQLYEVWFVRPNGRVSAGTFAVGPSGRARVVLASAARAGEYERLGMTREPDGLDPARNGPNVLSGRLPSSSRRP